jgi:hypothetical protein
MIQYAEQQLHVLCASRTAPAHYACDAAHQMSKNNPTLTNKITAWKELVGRLNDPSKQDSEKEPIYEKLIADGKEYRRLHFDEFEELEKTDKLNSFLFMFRDQAWRER